MGSWLIKIIINRKFILKRTPLDLPLLLFLLSQIISTIFSIDSHVSIWGYYSRFNGGLLSTISYILLYYAFVSNFPKEKIKKILLVVLGSGFLVSIYGILEHFGIDKDIWVQDVQNRVFSTLGQPNWLAAYLAVLIPISIGFVISNIQIKNQKYFIFAMYFLSFIFYICLLFTKSRSGFIGLWISLIVFYLSWVLFTLLTQKLSQNSPHLSAIASICGNINRLIGIFAFYLILVTFILGTPFPQINRFTLPELINTQSSSGQAIEQPSKPLGGSVIDIGITESGIIRRIVWKGALDIFKNHPLFGTGVETFAFAYYKYRPVEHNMTSEWDFLYNKAHNEYLNFAANTGAFGLGSYLFIIVVFIGWIIKNSITYHVSRIKYAENKIIPNTYYVILNTGLFASWLSILITNFFGFSVVVIQLFFFLIPAISFVLSESHNTRLHLVFLELGSSPSNSLRSDSEFIPRIHPEGQAIRTSNYQLIIILIILFFIFYFLYFLARLWLADVFYANAYHLSRAQDFSSSYETIKKAISINRHEPLYYDEISYPAAQIALAFDEEKQATLSSAFRDEAILASEIAINTSPNNVNFWKTRTRVFYALSQIEEKYYTDTLVSLEKARLLSPTDPKIRYNLALLYDRTDKKKEAVAELLETTKLKPDYRDAFYALSFFYEKDGKKKEAKEAVEYILNRIATNDAEAKKRLEELK